MIYSSTRGSDINLKFGDVLLNGLAKDGGLYVPNSVKSYSEKELDSLRELDYSSLAFELTKDFVLGEISVSEYKKICCKFCFVKILIFSKKMMITISHTDPSGYR